jgi:hypothetical protein
MHQVIKALCLAPLLYLPASSAVPVTHLKDNAIVIVYAIGNCAPEYVIVSRVTSSGVESVTYKFKEITTNMAKNIDAMGDIFQDLVKKCV